jgi:hypothetical protein
VPIFGYDGCYLRLQSGEVGLETTPATTASDVVPDHIEDFRLASFSILVVDEIVQDGRFDHGKFLHVRKKKRSHR